MSRIMVVDDDSDHVFVLKIALRKGGYDVVEAYGGKECLSKIAKVKPDLVIMDIMMPDMNGWDVCKRIKEDPLTSAIPVSMLSVRGEEEDIRKSFDYAHADEHMCKPIELGKLISTVEVLLNRAAT